MCRQCCCRIILKDCLNTYCCINNCPRFIDLKHFLGLQFCVMDIWFRAGRIHMASQVYELNWDFWLRCFCFLWNISSRIDFLIWRQCFTRASPMSEHLPSPWLNHAFDGPLVKASHNDKPRVNVQGDYVGCRYPYGASRRLYSGVFHNIVKWPQRNSINVLKLNKGDDCTTLSMY